MQKPAAGSAWLEDADLKRFETVARFNAWSNDEAQAALTEYVELVEVQRREFAAQTYTDREYGGARLEETQRLAQRAINAVRPPGHPRREAFLRLLARGGYGDHIEAVSFFADLGAKLREDQPALGTTPPPGGSGLSLAERLYPNHSSTGSSAA